jgi:hypothetical protein
VACDSMLLYRQDLSTNQRIALALHSGTQLSLVVAITAIAMQRRFMPSPQAAAMVGGGILALLLFPALARPFLSERRTARVEPNERFVSGASDPPESI